MRRALLGLLFASACATAPSDFTLPTGGRVVYEGTVFGAGDDPVFLYTRSSAASGPHLTSVHSSREHASGDVVVEQAAEHSTAYALQRAVEHHRQLGVRSEAVVDGHQIRMTTSRNGRTRSRTERLRAPAVVGPTLFGFILSNWEALADGQVLDVRFVVPEERRTYGFRLRMQQEMKIATVAMDARSAVVRAFVPPMRITFDAESRAVVRYEGWVPPRLDGRRLEARVEYEHHGGYR